jgi:hypothetical protein
MRHEPHRGHLNRREAKISETIYFQPQADLSYDFRRLGRNLTNGFRVISFEQKEERTCEP